MIYFNIIMINFFIILINFVFVLINFDIILINVVIITINFVIYTDISHKCEYNLVFLVLIMLEPSVDIDWSEGACSGSVYSGQKDMTSLITKVMRWW